MICIVQSTIELIKNKNTKIQTNITLYYIMYKRLLQALGPYYKYNHLYNLVIILIK